MQKTSILRLHTKCLEITARAQLYAQLSEIKAVREKSVFSI